MGYCEWASTDELDRQYHDHEWGIPVHDDRHMFEHLTLECLQCGLSWALMLKKREIFRTCFDNFEFDKIAAYGESDIERILNTEGMIRSPRKVQAVINNARCYQQVREEYGSFCNYIWDFAGGKTILYQGHALVGKTLIAITNLPPRKMMGIESCGMLLSAVNNLKDSEDEELHLLMVDNHIPAGAKLY